MPYFVLQVLLVVAAKILAVEVGTSKHLACLTCQPTCQTQLVCLVIPSPPVLFVPTIVTIVLLKCFFKALSNLFLLDYYAFSQGILTKGDGSVQ